MYSEPASPVWLALLTRSLHTLCGTMGQKIAEGKQMLILETTKSVKPLSLSMSSITSSMMYLHFLPKSKTPSDVPVCDHHMEGNLLRHKMPFLLLLAVSSPQNSTRSNTLYHESRSLNAVNNHRKE